MDLGGLKALACLGGEGGEACQHLVPLFGVSSGVC